MGPDPSKIVSDRIAWPSIIDPIGATLELLKEFDSPDGEWLAEPDSCAALDHVEYLDSADTMRMVKKRKLREINTLAFDAVSLERELRSMIMADATELLREVYVLCGITEDLDYDEDARHGHAPVDLGLHIRELAEVLSAVHRAHPELIFLAMQGRLASAARLVTDRNYYVPPDE